MTSSMIWNVAKKHNAGIEMVKRWYKWNGVKVHEDYLQQCIDVIEKYNVQSLINLRNLCPDNKKGSL